MFIAPNLKANFAPQERHVVLCEPTCSQRTHSLIEHVAPTERDRFVGVGL